MTQAQTNSEFARAFENFRLARCHSERACVKNFSLVDVLAAIKAELVANPDVDESAARSSVEDDNSANEYRKCSRKARRPCCRQIAIRQIECRFQALLQP